MISIDFHWISSIWRWMLWPNKLLARPEDTRGRPQGREASPAGPRDIVDTSRHSQDGPDVASEAP